MNNRALKNASWMVGCKVVQSLLSLVIGMITARYLGPSNYGVVSYVASVVAFVLPIMQLGLNQTIVKEFINSPQDEGKILGTAILFNIISSIFCMLGSIAFVMVAEAGDKETLIVCILYSFTILFQATEMTQYWFQAKLLSKYSSIASLLAYVIVTIYKILLLITQKSVIWFAFSNVLDYILISFILLIIYKKLGGQRFSFDFSLGLRMLSRSKYYIIPSLMVRIFQHTDKIMINTMLGKVETGVYSAAITCIGISGFVFSAVIDSARPIVLESKKQDRVQYENNMVRLYCVVTYLSLFQSVIMTVLAKPIIMVMYGEKYLGSVVILMVAVWYVTFSYYGSVRNVWILAEGLQRYLLPINIIGASLNVLLNFLLIPSFGGVGAAIASFITQFFSNVIMGFIIAPIRENNKYLIKGINPKILIQIVLSMLNKKTGIDNSHEKM